MAPKQLCAASRSVVIVDDIISTGGMIAMPPGGHQQGGTNVFAVCVHGALTAGLCPVDGSGIWRHAIRSDTIERGAENICCRYHCSRTQKMLNIDGFIR